MADPIDLTIGAPTRPEVAAPDKPKALPGTAAAGRTGDPRARESGVAPDPVGVDLVVDEKMVRRVLKSTTGAVSAVIGDEDVPNHWRFTQDELDEIVPPLTKFINRTPRLMLAMQHGDELALLESLAGYGFRNYMDGRAAQEARREREGQAEGSPTGGDVRLGGPLPGDGDHGQGPVGGAQR